MNQKRKMVKISGEGTAYIVEEEKKNKEKEKDSNKILSIISLSSEIGFVIVLPIAGGAIFGAYLDKKFGTAPKLMISLLLGGLVLAIYNVYRVIKEIEQRDNNGGK